jgi:tartrate-resistant acid phosphatase type 5
MRQAEAGSRKPEAGSRKPDSLRAVPEFHSEPYVYLAGLTHKSALIAWGAFYFKTRSNGRARLVDDEDLQWVHPPRCDSIGCASKPYGPARVEVHDASGACVASALTSTHNHAAIAGLKPDTRYTYSVTVKHEIWGAGVRWEWDPQLQGLAQQDRVYRNEFRTLPDPTAPLVEPFSFVVIGDFGVGMRKPSSAKRRQLEVAQALERAVDAYDARLIITTGDNIYASRRFLLWTGDSGDEDDDWFFTYFQPYRYVLNRIPVWPSIGNHDTRETEEHDDRDQVMDNMYLRERLAGEEAAGRASVEPGLFYRFRASADIEFVCIDTSKEDFFRRGRLYEYPKHSEFVEKAFPAAPEDRVKWRIPFGHHPPFSAGPQHHNTRGMETLIQLFQRSGVRAHFSGHEHNFQHSRVDGIDYFVSGAGAKIRRAVPDAFVAAHTRSWSGECHFLLVTVDGDRMIVRAIGDSPGATLLDIVRHTPSGEAVQGAIDVGVEP